MSAFEVSDPVIVRPPGATAEVDAYSAGSGASSGEGCDPPAPAVPEDGAFVPQQRGGRPVATIALPGAAPVVAAAPELEVVSVCVYRGPNYWSYEPAINMLVDLGSLEQWPTNRIPGFAERLVELIPELGTHPCSRRRPGGFLERLAEGTWLGHVTEHVALALQADAGFHVRRGKTRSTGEPGRYQVIYSYENERVGLAAGKLAVRIVNHLVAPEPDFDPNQEMRELLRLARRTRLGPSTQAILDEAHRRDIPSLRLDERSLIQLGQGVHQHRIKATVSSSTGAVGVDVASDKELTKRLLRGVGVPVAPSEVVFSPEDAVAAAQRIGLPVVVKPPDGNHGRGVSLALQDEAEIRDAFERARVETRTDSAIVERHVTGHDYRLLVIGGKVVAAAQRVPAQVVGDQIATIRELVERTNTDPRRGEGHEAVLTRIELDEQAERLLARQQLHPEAVPARGQVVVLADTANLSTGGIALDCTDDVHPDNAAAAAEAALAVGLDVAGVDLVASDIRRPISELGGAVIEVNAAPGFRMHLAPSEGQRRDVTGPLVDLLFPPGAPSRIPIVAVTGSNGKTTTVRMISHIARRTGRTVGMTSTDGVYVNDRLILEADASGPKSARMLLAHPRVELAVLETARGGILREGLGYDRSDVAVVLNVSGDHLGLGGITSIEQLADLKQVIVEAVPRGGIAVLNADDPLVARMADACLGEVMFVSTHKTNAVVDRHCNRGGRAVVVETIDGVETITLRVGNRPCFPIVVITALPSTFGGAAWLNVENAVAAAAAAIALDVRLDDVRHGLLTFTTAFHTAPGRLNVVDSAGVKVIIDYGHNTAAMRALGQFVDRLVTQLPLVQRTVDDLPVRVRPRRIAVVGTAGDRGNEELRTLGSTVAYHFDEVLIREDDNLRGRPPGEMAALVAGGVLEAVERGAPCQVVEPVLDEPTAVKAALARAQPGDVVVLCVEHAARAWQCLSGEAQAATLDQTAAAPMIATADPAVSRG
jgi:cyanophycin synthetase